MAKAPVCEWLNSLFVKEKVVECGECCHEYECDNRLDEASGYLLAYDNGQDYHQQSNGIIGKTFHLFLGSLSVLCRRLSGRR